MAGKPNVVKMEGKMDPKEFQVPAQDHRGHSARVGFRVTPEMRRAISVVIAKAPGTGWVTDSDFWRWAGRHALQHMEQKIGDKAISNAMHQQEVIRRVLVEREHLLQFQKTFDDMEKVVQDLIQGDQVKEARKMLLIIETEIQGMDNDDWRKSWKKKFDQKFGVVVGGAKLGETEQEED